MSLCSYGPYGCRVCRMEEGARAVGSNAEQRHPFPLPVPPPPPPPTFLLSAADEIREAAPLTVPDTVVAGSVKKEQGYGLMAARC